MTTACCCTELTRVLPPEPTSESVRIRIRRECTSQQTLPTPLDSPPSCSCRYPESRPSQQRQGTTGERDHLLRRISRCPVYRQHQHTGGTCVRHVPGAVHGISEIPHPYRIHQNRQHSRIRGIEDIATFVRNPSAGERTARLRSSVETAAAAAIRHGEHYRTRPPPPPCRPPRLPQQPGVPLPPQTPCLLGTQRVDYSNPIAK